MFESPLYNAMAAQHIRSEPDGPAGTRRITVSARKLAATLWELQEIPLSARGSAAHKIKEIQLQQHQQQPTSELLRTPCGRRNLVQLAHAASPAFSQRSIRRSSVQYKLGDSARRNPPSTVVTSAQLQAPRLADGRAGARPPLYSHDRNGDLHEADAEDSTLTHSNSNLTKKAAPTDAGNGQTTSTELLKVLNRVWTLEEQHNSSMSTISGLRADLERTRARVQELTNEQKSHRKAMENLNKKLADEKLMWLEREQEAIRVATQHLKEELEDERKAKRKLDLLHKKVAKELIDAKKSLGKALQGLEREQKARELMEDVCDELAREIGEDKAQVEELKRESAKVREEVEEERKMLQVAEVWREERVQMKLAEARLELEEKNTALDNVRSELEAFLKAKRAWEAQDEGSCTDMAEDSSDVCRSAVDLKHLVDEGRPTALHPAGLENSNEVGLELQGSADSADVSELQVTPQPSQELDDESSVDDDDSSVDDDDLHSIELNKESLLGSTEGPQWSYPPVTQQELDSNSRRSIDCMENPGQAGRHGLERTHLESMMADGEDRERSGKWDYQPDSQWIERSIERSELREWKGDSVELREGLHSPWQSESEVSQGNAIVGTRTKGRTLHGHSSDSFSESQVESAYSNHEAGANSELYGNGAVWSLQNLGSSRELKGASLVQQSANLNSSPTRRWAHYWPSPDLGSSRPLKAAASNDIPSVTRDSGSKAKLEGQQAWLRTGKGV